MIIKLSRFFHSLIGYFAITAALSFSLLIAGVFYDGNRTLKTAVLENVLSGISQTSQILNMTVSTYVLKNDLNTVKIFFSEMLNEHAENGLIYVVIGDAHGTLLLSTLAAGEKLAEPTSETGFEQAALKTGEVHVRNPLLLAHREIGFLQYGISTKSLIDATAREQQQSLLRTSAIMLATLLVILLLGWRISHRLKEMALASQAIVAGNYEQKIDISGRDELAALGNDFNLMAFEINKKIKEITVLNQTLELRVAQRTAELESSNRLLSDNLQHLKNTQTQLVNSEKLSSLGSLVAGVAHELNTPIGNALTVATAMTDKVQLTQQAFEAGQLKKSLLESHFNTLNEAGYLLTTNILRASDLIMSFKTIAVDQTSELRRKFDLKKLIAELELTLRVQLKHSKVSLDTEVADQIQLDSFPGPLTQVIFNLFNNALLHAFEDGKPGVIRISASLHGATQSHVLISFSDNGSGIPAQHLSKIFDPFFTTKFGQGGSGLGLHICHNLVEAILGGRLSVFSEPGQGARFDILIPLRAPEHARKAEG
ncbi:sensor histidine kinase [Undibacterium curvum]|uniref:histidine kinase n=1 Tax=Undibacterium curvum TaxID=2762294 RepID=A0ABR7A0P5_9BURK|nr:ATP-binding protein [Undibacterium curvum]MBC3930267.1 HAMP domain-containing protein [Undibacterium curvum]